MCSLSFLAAFGSLDYFASCSCSVASLKSEVLAVPSPLKSVAPLVPVPLKSASTLLALAPLARLKCPCIVFALILDLLLLLALLDTPR